MNLRQLLSFFSPCWQIRSMSFSEGF